MANTETKMNETVNNEAVKTEAKPVFQSAAPLKMDMIAGLDIGNGYVKGAVSVNGKDPTGIDFLSGVAFQTNSHDIKVREADAGSVIEDIFDQLEASFDSAAVEDSTRRLFGRRGISSGKSMEEFDVSSTVSKAVQDLSGILVLGSLAGKAVQEYWEACHKLPPDILRVKARISIALPITEFKTHRKQYASRFKEGSHIVSIHNFESPLRVEITVTDVQVLAEGASAQYAIIDKGRGLMESMLQDLRRHGQELPNITADDILQAENTVGVDIGEGTVNFPVFQDGRFNPDASATFSKGYGTVLEQARERLQEMNMAFNSRKALADFLQRKPSPMQQARFNKVAQIVDEEIFGFTQEIKLEFSKVVSRVGAYLEVVYVYGGGANAVKESLYPQLIGVVKNLGGAEEAYPILYLDSRYSRYLNREGLFLIAKRLADTEAK